MLLVVAKELLPEDITLSFCSQNSISINSAVSCREMLLRWHNSARDELSMPPVEISIRDEPLFHHELSHSGLTLSQLEIPYENDESLDMKKDSKENLSIQFEEVDCGNADEASLSSCLKCKCLLNSECSCCPKQAGNEEDADIQLLADEQSASHLRSEAALQSIIKEYEHLMLPVDAAIKDPPFHLELPYSGVSLSDPETPYKNNRLLYGEEDPEENLSIKVEEVEEVIGNTDETSHSAHVKCKYLDKSGCFCSLKEAGSEKAADIYPLPNKPCTSRLRHSEATPNSVTAECDNAVGAVKSKRKSNVRRINIPRLLKCSVCDWKSKYVRALKQHILLHNTNSEELFTCSVCDFKTRHDTSLQSHMLAHSDNAKLFKCSDCNYITNWENAIKRHVAAHDNIAKRELFQCAECDYKTKYKSRLAGHLLKHTNPKKNSSLSCLQLHNYL